MEISAKIGYYLLFRAEHRRKELPETRMFLGYFDIHDSPGDMVHAERDIRFRRHRHERYLTADRLAHYRVVVDIADILDLDAQELTRDIDNLLRDLRAFARGTDAVDDELDVRYLRFDDNRLDDAVGVGDRSRLGCGDHDRLVRREDERDDVGRDSRRGIDDHVVRVADIFQFVNEVVLFVIAEVRELAETRRSADNVDSEVGLDDDFGDFLLAAEDVQEIVLWDDPHEYVDIREPEVGVHHDYFLLWCVGIARVFYIR